ncbi:hypothetical protein Tco_0302975 [Tanacetum coccineum]
MSPFSKNKNALLRSKTCVDEQPLPNYQKWQKYVSSFKPDIPETPLYKSKPMISKDYKKETDVKVGQIFENKEALDLAIRLKALDEGYQFLNDRSAPERHAAIALTVQNEFPLAYHDEATHVIKFRRDISSTGGRLNDYDTNVMYDIAKVAGKIQLFVSHHQIDLSTVLIPNDGSLEEAFAGFINKTIPTTPYTQTNFNFVVYNNGQLVLDDTKTTMSMASSANEARKIIVSKLQRELEAEATFANQLLCNLTRYREQMRIREIQMTMMQNMPTTSLNSYGLHALLMTHEADIRTTNNLIRARQELLRSIAEKQNFINSYMAI